MLTLNSHLHLPTTDDASAHGPTAQRPAANYMFVASDPCTSNNKPNKTIRSFVMKATRKDKSWSTSTTNPRKKKEFKKKKTTTVVTLDDQSLQNFNIVVPPKAGPSKFQRLPKGIKVERRKSDQDHLFKVESPTAPSFGSNSAINGAPTTPFTVSTDFGSTSSSSTLSNCAPYDTPDFADDVTVTPNYMTPTSHVFAGSYMDLDNDFPLTQLSPLDDPLFLHESLPCGSHFPIDQEDESSCVAPHRFATWASYNHNHTQDQSASQPQQQLVAQRLGYSLEPLSNISEPVATMPLPLNHYDTSLLNEFFKTTVNLVNPLDIHKRHGKPSEEHFSRCMHSPFGKSFISTMLYAQQLGDEMRAGNAKEKSEQYRSNATTALYEDVKQQGMIGGPVDDAVIATVQMLYCLADAELASSRTTSKELKAAMVKNVATHRKGLESLIQSKGGMSGLRSNRCLYAFIIMDSMARAIATFTEPYAAPLDDEGKVETYRPVCNDKIFFLPNIIQPVEKLGVNTTLVHIIDNMAFYIADLNSSLDNRMYIDAFDLQKHACIFMYRLYRWHETNTDAPPMDRSLCLALLIFIINISEPDLDVKGKTVVQSNIPCPRLSRVVSKLHAALQEISTEIWSEVPRLQLWVVTMCGLGAYRLPAVPLEVRSFCQDALRTPDPAITLTTDSLLSTMQMWLWVPVIFEKKARNFWIELGLCSREVVDVSDIVLNNSNDESDDTSVKDEHLVGRSTDARFLR